MDKAQILHWLSYHGINSMDELVLCYSSLDPMYKINGNTLYLDTWIYENLSSVYRFIIKAVQEYKIVPENKHWLSIKSINVFERQGFKINIPPQAQIPTLSNPSPTQV